MGSFYCPLPSRGIDKGGSCCSPPPWSLHHGCASQLPIFRLIQVRVRHCSLPPNMGSGHKWTQVGLFTCFLTLHLNRVASENLWLSQHPASLRYLTLFVSTIPISLLAGGTALADEEKNAASLQLQKNSFLLGLVFS